MLLKTTSAVNAIWLEQALNALWQHHDALRLRFAQVRGQWTQINAPVELSIHLRLLDLSMYPAVERATHLAMEADRVQASFNLAQGPLLQAVLFSYGPAEPGRLLLVVHHLVADGVSWRILLEDLQDAYRALAEGRTLHLDKTTAFRDWAHWLETTGVQRVTGERAWWQQVVSHANSALPLDMPAGVQENTVASAEEVICALSADETHDLLHKALAAYHAQINDLLLAALAKCLCQWCGTDTFFLDLEGHGREFPGADDEAYNAGIDLTRTVGWFTALFPVMLRYDRKEPGALIKSIKEQLRRIPHHGVGYGILRYLGGDNTLIPAKPAGISFNYLGQFDGILDAENHVRGEKLLLEFARETSGQPCSPTGRRPHVLDINGILLHGQLTFSWTYSRNVHQRATIEQLARSYLETLRSLLAHCLAPAAGGFTPSDFPEAQVDQAQLDQLLAKLSLR
jgi:non-ribosomal peptide synthase protein (TIGR01720 family)